MYKVAPILDNYVDIDLPTCMYKYQLPKGPAYDDTNPKTGDISDLESKQNSIFERILKLKERVDQLKADTDNAPKPETKSSSENINKTTPAIKVKLGKTASNDIVINVNPNSFPLAVWLLHQIFSKSSKVYLKSYVHSSVTQVPVYLKYFETIPNTTPRSQCDLILIVIWKEDVVDQEMIVDPIKSSTIRGESNIARYLARISNSFYENLGLEEATEIDRLLDLFNFTKSSHKEQQSVLRNLNAYIGRKSFLVGEGITLADIVLWSQLVEAKLQKTLPKNLNVWFKNLQAIEAFSSVPASLIEGA